MIHDHDRSGWFGASDTATIMGRWDTKTFRQFWLQKLGLNHDYYTNLQMETGTAFEHRILEFIGVNRMDRQIKIRGYRLRVNLDGETSDEISEVKTHKSHTFKVSMAYWMQAQVEMHAARKNLRIVAYNLEPDDYKNWFREIDADRLSYHKIEYDHAWVENEYLPRIRYLAHCLRKGVFPIDGDYIRERRLVD